MFPDGAGSSPRSSCTLRLRNAILKSLLRFPWWRVPSTPEAWEQSGSASRHGLARRRRQAAAELEMMATLPPLTCDPVLEQKVNFGLVPATAMVRPGDRQLSFFH